MPNFTDLSVRNLEPGIHFDKKMPAFGIRVGKLKKTWIIIKGHNRTKVRLGHYPKMGLAEARKRALATLGMSLHDRPRISFPDALVAFLDQPRWKPNSKRVIESSLKHFSWKKQIDKITHEDVLIALEAIKAPSAKSHAFKDIRAFFNWCVPRYLLNSPCVGIKIPKQKPRERVLSDTELCAVWKSLKDDKFSEYVKLLILTGQRRGEIGHISIDGNTATIPAEHTKNGKEHIFPIPQLAVQFLPARYYNSWSNPKKRLDKRCGVNDWTLHDLRRTFATNHARLGTPIHVVEKLLNHVSGSFAGVAGIYNRYSYQDEMKEACERYESLLASLGLGVVKT